VIALLNFSTNQPIELIRLSRESYEIMLSHCRRKLAGESYLPGEDQDRKAFGLLGGRVVKGAVEVIACSPLLRNARQCNDNKDYMDQMMTAHAIPSETPFTERGWVADTDELTAALKSYRDLDLLLIGTYHMHRVAWPHDHIRDTPTTLDTMLGSNSRMLMFILSMVDPAKPILRAFYEGEYKRETPIHYIASSPVTSS